MAAGGSAASQGADRTTREAGCSEEAGSRRVVESEGIGRGVEEGVVESEFGHAEGSSDSDSEEDEIFREKKEKMMSEQNDLIYSRR